MTLSQACDKKIYRLYLIYYTCSESRACYIIYNVLYIHINRKFAFSLHIAFKLLLQMDFY